MREPALTLCPVYTQETILARHRGKLPSMRVYLYPSHFRINDSQETLTYASPMRELLTAMREKKLQHKVDLRSATYVIAIEKIARSYLERGIFP